jgi:ribosomal protein S18 acetylase RimI-like enzyme
MSCNTGLIRSASRDDAIRLGALARTAYAKYVARIGREPAPMRADFAAEIAAGRVMVIETEGLIVGYMVAAADGDAYVIDDIAIDPTLQGRGFGRQLMKHAMWQAKYLHLPFVRLYTNAAMTENLAMYAHLGFVETHCAREQGFDRVHLQLTL